LINQKTNSLLSYLAIIAGGALLFFPFLGNVALFDWDEVNFAEIAREMIVTKDYLSVQIDYKPFWEKPPLFMWMQVLSMKLFGINEFAARFPNAICGIATLLAIFAIGKKIFNQKMGLIWVLVYAGSILPFFYFKSGIIDPWFNLFIFLGVYFAVIYLHSESHKPQAASHKPQATSDTVNRHITPPPFHLFLSGIFIGLAILTKGPVALIIFGLTGFIYLLIIFLQSYRPTVLKSYRPTVLPSYSPTVRIKLIHILLFIAGLILTGGSWFIVQIFAGNLDTVKDFIIYQARLFSTKDAGHGGFPGYHIVILLLGVFPASAFLFNGFKADSDEQPLQKDWRRANIILLLTVVILFEIVQTKIVHYSSLAYFPLTYLAALAIYRMVEGKSRLNKLSAIVLGALAIVWIVVIIGFTLVGLNKEWLMNSGLLKDPFAVANLAADVRWTGWEVVVSGVLVSGVLGFYLLKKPLMKIVSLFGTTMIFTFLTMIVFTAKIEGYTQTTVNTFYEQHSTEDCYIRTLGFKSYAHYFYGNTQPHENPLYYDNNWLLTGKIDKPAYFVYKMTKKEEYSRIYPQLTILYEKNGFIFAARYPE
jgi:4-amino-4-deoxy-L-arabinose transferase-like glycosyltransferase